MPNVVEQHELYGILELGQEVQLQGLEVPHRGALEVLVLVQGEEVHLVDFVAEVHQKVQVVVDVEVQVGSSDVDCNVEFLFHFLQ